MKLAVNYSLALAELVAAGRVRADLIKSADFPEMVSAAMEIGPTCVHFGLEAGSGATADLDAVEALAAQTGTQAINTHLVCRGRSSPMIGRSDVSAATVAAVVERTLRDVAPVVGRFGPGRVMIENLIYHGPGVGAEDWCLAGVFPAVFSSVTAAADVGLLLDVSHARIACHYAGWDVWDYLDAMPTGRLRELHITGLAMHNGLLTDHMPMTDADWEFASQIIQRIRRGDWQRPDVVALEYGGTGLPFAWRTDPAVLAADVPRLAELLAGI